MNAMKGYLLCVALLSMALALSAQTPQWEWAVGAGGTGWEKGLSIAVNSAGNTYLTGYFRGTASFGTHTITSQMDLDDVFTEDIFVSKLDPNGNWLWTVRAGGQNWERGHSIAVDSAGNAYLTGYFRQSASFGTHHLHSYVDSDLNHTEDIFVAKLDPDGNWLWAVKAGGTDRDQGIGIAVDDSGNAYVTGYFEDTATFGSQTLTAIGWYDIFTAKLDPSGNWLWVVKAGGTGMDQGYGIALDGVGNTCVTGGFHGTATFGTNTLTASGVWGDIFVAKLDPDGNWLWAVSTGGISNDSGNAIAVDDSGNAYVTGYFKGTASFGPHTLISSGGADIFAAKLDPSGNWLWAVQAGGTVIDVGHAIALDGSGNTYVTGYFEGTATFGSHTLTASGETDIFAAKLNPAGNWLWALSAGGIDRDAGYSIAVDGSGNAFLTGAIWGTASFGTHTITLGLGDDIFVAKLISGTPVDEDLAPEAFSRLYDAYPNPLRHGQTATITTKVAERETGILTILNLRGQVVSRHTLSPGSHQISLPSGNLPSGVYLYQLRTPSCSEVKKLVLLK